MGKLKLLLIIIIAAAGISAGAIYFLGIDVLGTKSAKGQTAEEQAELSVDTDVITTNLASSGNFAVVQFNILLDNKEAKEELEIRKPEVREAIISTVAGYTKEQLIGRDGINNLENELFDMLNTIVQLGEVERVLVTEYKLQ